MRALCFCFFFAFTLYALLSTPYDLHIFRITPTTTPWISTWST